MCPVGGKFFGCECMVCHCLLIETDAGLVLVDTGLGEGSVNGERPLPLGFRKIVRPKLDPAQTALAQVRDLGYSPDDVRHIVLTHLDLDHGGGLPDFPKAAVHVHAREKDAALGVTRAADKTRYLAQHWAHQPSWRTYEASGERWQGFDAVRQLDGLGPEILLIPLHGHSEGHCGVAVQTDQGWLLHAGDAYFHRAEIRPGQRAPAALKAFQRLLCPDNRARLHNQQRLRQLASEPTIEVICSHDPAEFEAVGGMVE